MLFHRLLFDRVAELTRPLGELSHTKLVRGRPAAEECIRPATWNSRRLEAGFLTQIMSLIYFGNTKIMGGPAWQHATLQSQMNKQH